MAYPTQITIASGKTVYAGDEEDGITSRQVQVQVTYQLERGDGDLLLVTARKAKEVEAAQAAVWRQVRGEQTEMDLPHDLPSPPGDEDDPLQSEDDEGDDPGEDPPLYDGDGDGPDEGGGAAPAYRPGGTGTGYGRPCPGGTGTGYGRPCPGDRGQNGDGHADASSEDSGARPRGVTKPQRLAIQAQARRLGLGEQALAETIRERFGKESFTPRFAVDKLSKAEADVLLRALCALEPPAPARAYH
ncbi:MAG: hypothetical protein JO250_20850 [Armatimonadetes bacterium]|nr:hypothetical protein [Armatimonadota bacterium]